MKETYSDFQRYGGKLTLNPIRNYKSKGTKKDSVVSSTRRDLEDVDRSKSGRKSAVKILVPNSKGRDRASYYYEEKKMSLDALRKIVKVSSSTLTKFSRIADMIEVNGYIIEIKDLIILRYNAVSDSVEHIDLPLKEICKECGCSSPTIKRYADTDDLLYGVWKITVSESADNETINGIK